MINWNMPGPQNNALAYFQFGNQLGQQAREQKDARDERNALAKVTQYMGGGGAATPPVGGQGIVADPAQDERQFNELMRPLEELNPAAAMRIRQMRQQEIAARGERKRADMPLVTRLIESSVDEASYQRNRAIAQEYGIDTASLPQTFDPAWRDQQLTTLKALQDPKAQEALSAAGKMAMDMGFKPGTVEFNHRVTDIFLAQESKPYVVGGETRLSMPRLGGGGASPGGIPPEAVDALRRGEGTPEQFDQMFGPGAAARVMGGQAATPPATFP